jgi:transcriptional regulator with XRE-family HTH domain
MEITAQDLRTLRYRMNWTQAELAQTLGCTVDALLGWERGHTPCELSLTEKSRLLIFQAQADSNSAQVQRRAVAENLMVERQLSQIVDQDVIECLTTGHLSNSTFR